MDLENKTQVELLELRGQINEALNEYGNRSKTKVFSTFVFGDWRHFRLEKNAKNEIIEHLQDEEITDDEIKIKCTYLNDAELPFCIDDHEFNHPEKYL